MEKETALRVIDILACGNENMRRVMSVVYFEGKPVIDKWPDNRLGLFSRKIIRVTGNLIHERICPRDIVSEGAKYWQSENGKRVDAALTKFVETRTKKNVK